MVSGGRTPPGAVASNSSYLIQACHERRGQIGQRDENMWHHCLAWPLITRRLAKVVPRDCRYGAVTAI